MLSFETAHFSLRNAGHRNFGKSLEGLVVKIVDSSEKKFDFKVEVVVETDGDVKCGEILHVYKDELVSVDDIYAI